MNRPLVDRIARAVLYEGYMLYPYRSSALKNSRRLTFGTLYPERTGQRSYFQAECLLLGAPETRLSVLVRFLDPGGAEHEVCMETALSDVGDTGSTHAFSTPAHGEIVIAAAPVFAGAFKLTIIVRNRSDIEFGSTHAAVSASGGEFVSVTDPPPQLMEAAARCVNTGVWPVLVGDVGSRDTILASPIILSDYPQVAPESTGDLYDATEIEEILALRVLTLTDEEKAQARSSDPRARGIVDRADTLPAEHMMRLHGVIRGVAPWDNSLTLPRIVIEGSEVKTGDRVRLKPRRRADIFDSLLEGRIAVIEAIEQDFEDNIHLAVVLEDDPGRDLGEMRQAAHRFFYSPDEVEPVPSACPTAGVRS